MQIEKAHSIFSPSKAKMYLHCAPSVALNKDLPDSTSSAAKEGTIAHAVAEYCLRKEITLKPNEGISITVDGERHIINFQKEKLEMLNAVNSYVATVRSLAKGAKYFGIEEELDLSEVMQQDGEKGTSDNVIFFPEQLIVGDLKYGKGVKVHADHNEQLLVYALGALNKLRKQGIDLSRLKIVSLMIFQPRLDHFSEWKISPKDLMAFRIKLRSGVAKCKEYFEVEPDAIPAEDYGPSEDTCRWCKAKPYCVGLRREMEQTMFNDETKEEVKNPDTIDRQAVSEIFAKKSFISSWLTSIEEFVFNELLAGREIPGFKLVAGRRGNRSWKDKEEAEELMKKGIRLKRDEMYKQAILSVAQAETLLKKQHPKKWERLIPLIGTPAPTPAVVAVSDARPEWTTAAPADEFEDITEEKTEQKPPEADEFCDLV